jgi:hypothetical protein
MRTFLNLCLLFGLWSVPARAVEKSAYDSLVDEIKAAMVKACEVHPDCVRRVTSFAWFLYKNRDKSDIQINVMKCLGYSAVQRGYVWAPSKVLDDMTPQTAQEIAQEVCDCVVGYWGKDEVCPVTKDGFVTPRFATDP